MPAQLIVYSLPQAAFPTRNPCDKKISGPKRRVRVEGSALTFRTRLGANLMDADTVVQSTAISTRSAGKEPP